MLEYAGTGEAPQLSGSERFLFPVMRAQVDWDEAASEGLSGAQSIVGKKGAQARSDRAKQTKPNKQLPDLPGKPSYDKDKEKEKEKDKEKDEGEDSFAPARASPPPWNRWRQKSRPSGAAGG